MRAALSGDTGGPADARARDRDPERDGLGRGGADGGEHRILVGHVGADERGPVAELVLETATAVLVQVRDHDVGAAGVEAADRGLAET